MIGCERSTRKEQRGMGYPYAGTQHRPAVTGRRGMVSSAHALASLAGLRTLMEGGNAIDAAVAVAFCLGARDCLARSQGSIQSKIFDRESAFK
jgi:gamma-glutamyltranspeptidase